MPRPKGTINTYFLSDEEIIAEEYVQQAVLALKLWKAPDERFTKMKGPSYNGMALDETYVTLMELCKLSNLLEKPLSTFHTFKQTDDTSHINPEMFDDCMDVFRKCIPSPDHKLVWFKAAGMGWINLSKREGRPVNVIKLQYKNVIPTQVGIS